MPSSCSSRRRDFCWRACFAWAARRPRPSATPSRWRRSDPGSDGVRPMTSSDDESSTILIAAGLLVGKDDRVLLVRKRGTRAFMQPGGKFEPREAPLAALLRELHEELGLVIP